MSNTNSSINNNSNKDSDDSNNQGILLEISEDLKNENIVSEIKYIPTQKSLKISFSEVYDNETLYIRGDVRNWYAWTAKIETTLKKRMTKLNDNHCMLIENTIQNNLNLLLEAVTENRAIAFQGNNQKEKAEEKGAKTIQLKKYVLDGKLYESIILDKNPKFISLVSSSSLSANNTDEKPNDHIKFELFDKIDVPNYTFYPSDNLLTHNPHPYSFDSEDELGKYVDLVKKETFDTLFEKILAHLRTMWI